MTIPSTPRKAGPLLGTGSQTAWPFTFKVFAKSDIAVTIANSTGVETALVLDTHYSVALNANQETSPGGTVTYPISGTPLAVGSVLSIVGDLDYDQPLDLPSGGNFSPTALENQLDRLTMQVQQLRETIGRSLLVPVTSDAAPSLPSPEANQLIGWDATGETLQNVPISDLATAVAYGTFRYDTFTGNGSTTAFTLTSDPAAIGNLDVAINGLTMVPGTDYSLVSGVLTFSVAPSNGAKILARYGQALPISGPVDSSAVTHIASGAGAVTTTAQAKLRESVSVKDFGAVGNGVTDDTAAIQAAINASNGRKLIAPAGKYNHSQLTVPKTVLLHLEGEFDSYNNTEGTVFNYTGTGIGLQVGEDDGNPDATGPARGARISGVHFTTTSGQTAIRLQNTALAVVENCKTRNFRGKVIDLRANVITKVKDNDIAGTTGGSGCYGVYADEQYFGNYVLDICDNHIHSVNHAGRFSEGRSLTVHNNVVENIRPGGTGGVWKFETSGYISVASFQENYYENHRGYIYEGASFTGAVLNLVIKGEDGWGSADVGNVNPGVGNLPKTKVLAHDIRANLFVDSQWNTKGYLSLPAVYPTTSIFDSTTTIALGQITNREYEDDLFYAMRENELLKSAGDFADLTGGVAGTFTKTGGTPTGWTDLAAPDWGLVADGISGTFVCYVPAAGDYDRCEKVISLTPIARVRHFAIAFTVKGWAALKLNGGPIYDSNASLTTWSTQVILFSVASSAASFTLKFGTNSPYPFYIAEARLVEVGAGDANEPGTMNAAVQKAIKRVLKRGVYA